MAWLISRCRSQAYSVVRIGALTGSVCDVLRRQQGVSEVPTVAPFIRQDHRCCGHSWPPRDRPAPEKGPWSTPSVDPGVKIAPIGGLHAVRLHVERPRGPHASRCGPHATPWRGTKSGPSCGTQVSQRAPLTTSAIWSAISSMLNWLVLRATLSASEGLNVRTSSAVRSCQIGSSDCSPATVRVTRPSSS